MVYVGVCCIYEFKNMYSGIFESFSEFAIRSTGLMVLFSSLSLTVFCLLVLLLGKEWKSPAETVDVSISPFSCVGFLCMHFECLLGTYTLRIACLLRELTLIVM